MLTFLSRGLTVAAVLTVGSVAAAGAALAAGGMSMPGSAPSGTVVRPAAMPSGMPSMMPSGMAMATPDAMSGDMPMPDATTTTAVQPLQGNGSVYGAGRTAVLQAVLRDAVGRPVGSVRLTRLRQGGSLVQVRAWALTPGFHGFHLHTNGICDPAGATPFASAGGHFNPAGTAEGMQAGAFPGLLAGPDGHAAARFVDPNVVPADLLTRTGTSVVVHSLPDNYANIPPRYTSGGVAGPDQMTMATGDGGSRVACGVLVAPAS